MDSVDNTLISIITVCYNAASELEDTIVSVINQDYGSLEYIVVDGASSDGSVNIIKEYEKVALNRGIIFKWISEPDNGIYDAMNKGIEMATGEFVNFMNAGDSFCDTAIISNILYSIDVDEGEKIVVYGDTFYVNGGKKILKKARDLRTFYKGMPFCHQSVLVSTDLHRHEKFSTEYKLASDFDFFYKVYKRGDATFLYHDLVVSNFDRNGIAINQWKNGRAENLSVVMKNEPEKKVLWIINNTVSAVKRILKQMINLK